MTSRPSEYPDWATDDQADATSGVNNVVSAPSAYQTYGWTRAEKPPRQYWNWFGRYVSTWLRYLEERLTGTREITTVDAIPEDPSVWVRQPSGSVQNGWVASAVDGLWIPMHCPAGAQLEEVDLKCSATSTDPWLFTLYEILLNIDSGSSAPSATTICTRASYALSTGWNTVTMHSGVAGSLLPRTLSDDSFFLMYLANPTAGGDGFAGSRWTFSQWAYA